MYCMYVLLSGGINTYAIKYHIGVHIVIPDLSLLDSLNISEYVRGKYHMYVSYCTYNNL